LEEKPGTAVRKNEYQITDGFLAFGIICLCNAIEERIHRGLICFGF